MKPGTDLLDILARSGVDDPEGVIQVIAEHIEKNPGAIEQIAPGKKLVLRRMNPKDRAKIAVPAMNAGRAKARKERAKALAPYIYRILSARPETSSVEIARSFNNSNIGIKPSSTRETWMDFDVDRIMKDLNIDRKQPET